MFAGQAFREPDCLVGILIIVKEANPGLRLVAGASNLPLCPGIAIEVCRHHRAGNPRHRMRQRAVCRGIKSHRTYRNPCCLSCSSHIHLCSHYSLPPEGIFGSNCLLSKGLTGILGISAGAACPDAGSTIRGVTITISSELVLFILLERKR